MTLTVEKVVAQKAITMTNKHVRQSYPAAIRIYAGDSLTLFMRGGAIQWHVVERSDNGSNPGLRLARVVGGGEVVEHHMGVGEVLALIASGTITYKRMGGTAEMGVKP